MSTITRLDAVAFIYKQERYIRIQDKYSSYEWFIRSYDALGTYEGMRQVPKIAQELEEAYQIQEKINLQIFEEYRKLKDQKRPPFDTVAPI